MTHRNQRLLLAASVVLALAGTPGCGAYYGIRAFSTESKLETAQALGAEKYAPYEYFLAKEYLEKAKEEAATADYGDADHFVDVASDNAEKAIELSRAAHQGAGR